MILSSGTWSGFPWFPSAAAVAVGTRFESDVKSMIIPPI
jgi:hypothetical protein